MPENMPDTFTKTHIRFVILSLVFIGSLNYVSAPFEMNFLESLLHPFLYQTLSLLIVLAAIVLMINMTTWLPFLGETVLPGSLIPLRPGKGDIVVEVNVKPNTRIAFWAAKHNNESELPLVEDAYADYSNSGVVMSDASGKAILRIDPGTSYIVPNNKVIKKHIHYRELDRQYGMIGPVKTAYY